ncbi:Cytochrome c biogenesis protein CcdA [Streptoalloteichus tenebrarius]|uniref:Cytochrome c biogenesis protein CcdA n=1 Tax=Streptoalloteichus tenebrarius (strain ATCC 17920 / DSM 40477 / JCM 4838 / CBS 697.72 / NBRC 16177 / NCIMB 11028 / NRRL B-12390 / A12253. 1 / ISP 5477) TaxID=1933 RepID=A0ABT1HMG4_STRSD|nr:cytochrome c biogenesis CcdA family protein [Streptoalloteichus tenebrarius]MCP2256688.1 Cytochrome c biogenesis protein CcdA [Streptoalloteichus tenebrarius]BFF00413.1 cytochrome c biogenesis CcdA family protein [Streptoalloteichus tenebrarius]
MTGIGYLGAFLGGVLALVSPCSALLLPAFFAYAFADPVRLAARTGVFYLGLATTLVPLGVAASAVGGLLADHRDTVVLVGGLVLVLFGLLTILGRGFGVGAGLAQRVAGRTRLASLASVFALGAVYGLAGFCSGPLLGSVLTLSATGGDPAYGAALLAVYALGMVVPLFLLAALWDRLDLGRRRWLRGVELRLGRLRVHSTSLVSGLLFVGIGLLFLLTDGTGGLGGLFDVDQQYAAQVWVRRVADAVPQTAVLLGVAAVAAVVLALRLRRRPGAARTGDDGSGPEGDRPGEGPEPRG